MNANITGENDERVGLYVDDNDDIEHWVEIEFDGEIKYHEQDGYPDEPLKRTNREDELFSQARRYAKRYVYQNTDYDTLDFHRNPDRIAATLMTIYNMDSEEFEQQFVEFYQQVRSHADDSVDRPVPIESQRPSGEPVIYKLDLYLDAEIEELRGLSTFPTVDLLAYFL